jgi:hypothetical protein
VRISLFHYIKHESWHHLMLISMSVSDFLVMTVIKKLISQRRRIPASAILLFRAMGCIRRAIGGS